MTYIPRRPSQATGKGDIMTVVFAAICGLIQGFSEFLPISSSGHLALFQRLFFRDPDAPFLAFNVALHLGTLAAVLAVYRRDVGAIVLASLRLAAKAARGRLRFAGLDPDERTALALAGGTLAMIPAKLIDDRVEALTRCVWAVGLLLIVNAAILAAAQRRFARDGAGAGGLKPKTAFAIGAAQCAAVLPGISRSGASVSAGVACGLGPEFAVRFSFLLSVPAIAGAALFEIPEAARAGTAHADVVAYAVGACVAFISGVAAIKLLTYLTKRSNLRLFAYYCAAVGVIAVALGAAGVRFPVF